MDPVRVLGVDHFMGGVEVTDLEAILRTQEKLRQMKNGEIRLIVRNGEIKYINVLEEYIPDPPGDRGKEKI